MFGGKHKAKIAEYAKQMAGIVTGSVEVELDSFGFDTKDKRAYLQGYRCIEYLHLGTGGARRLVTSFYDELIEAGLPEEEAMCHLHKFWILYWTMQVGSTEGIAQRIAFKSLRRSKAALAKYE